MHERSLVKLIIEQVLEETRSRRLGRIDEILIQIGEFSGVEPRLVKSAFAEMALDFWDTEVRLSIDVVALAAMCQMCQTTFLIKNFDFVCPHCSASKIEIIAGEELKILSIRAERPLVHETCIKE